MITCPVVGCKNVKPKKFVLCADCWNKIPVELRDDIRRGTEKGNHTTKANPEKAWYEKVIPYTGYIKVPYVLGSGITAVKVANDKKELVTQETQS